MGKQMPGKVKTTPTKSVPAANLNLDAIVTRNEMDNLAAVTGVPSVMSELEKTHIQWAQGRISHIASFRTMRDKWSKLTTKQRAALLGAQAVLIEMIGERPPAGAYATLSAMLGDAADAQTLAPLRNPSGLAARRREQQDDNGPVMI